MHNHFLSALILFTGLAAPGQPEAQVLYRCGGTYQDRPCEKGVSEQRFIPGGGRQADAGGGADPQVAGSPYAAQCAQLGQQSQSISWKREGGATLEKQLNEAGGDRQRMALIEAVYSLRGSAPEIRAAIERRCVAERERQEELSRLVRAQREAGVIAPAPAAPAPAMAPPPAPAPGPGATATPATRTENPACASLRADLAGVDQDMRKPQSATAMDEHRDRRSRLQRRMSDLKC